MNGEDDENGFGLGEWESEALQTLQEQLDAANERVRVVSAQRDDYMRQRTQLAREVKMLTAKVKKLEGAK